MINLHDENEKTFSAAQVRLGPLGRYVSRRTLCERGLVLMVTYSELFQFVIMLCAVITLVIHFTRKK